MLSCVEHEKSFITSGPALLTLRQLYLLWYIYLLHGLFQHIADIHDSLDPDQFGGFFSKFFKDTSR